MAGKERLAPLIGCLLLIQADCFSGRPKPFSLAPREVPGFLSLGICTRMFHGSDGEGGCVPVVFESEKACLMQVSSHLEDSVEAALDANLHYAESCLERLDVEVGPPKQTSGTWLGCDDDCQFFFGDLPEGASCESLGHRMSDCAQGLVCAPDRICHQPCDYSFIAPEGGFCGPARGMWFVTCDAGLACGAEGTCEPAAAIGAACDAATACAVEGWCDPDTSSCVARLAADGPCVEHGQCVSDLCIEGVCFQPKSLECGRWGW